MSAGRLKWFSFPEGLQRIDVLTEKKNVLYVSDSYRYCSDLIGSHNKMLKRIMRTAAAAAEQ